MEKKEIFEVSPNQMFRKSISHTKDPLHSREKRCSSRTSPGIIENAMSNPKAKKKIKKEFVV